MSARSGAGPQSADAIDFVAAKSTSKFSDVDFVAAYSTSKFSDVDFAAAKSTSKLSTGNSDDVQLREPRLTRN